MSLVVNSYSGSSLINTLKSLNLLYSDDELTKIKDDRKSELNLFKRQELPESAFALLIDTRIIYPYLIDIDLKVDVARDNSGKGEPYQFTSTILITKYTTEIIRSMGTITSWPSFPFALNFTG